MEAFWTHGRWRVKSGAEDQFVAEWMHLADWAKDALPAAPWAVLLRDREDPSQFFSFGPFLTLEAIAEFRGRAEFAEALERMRPLLDSAETFTLDGVATYGTLVGRR